MNLHQPEACGYIGRFAPSPTGPVHMGTLVSAMAGYLDARRQRGKWLLRIEDLDRPREVAGAANAIIRFLEDAGFQWDDEIIYQSQRNAFYREALAQLDSLNMIYNCECSRKQLNSVVYPGNCRNKLIHSSAECAVRLKTSNDIICFEDRIRGKQQQNLLLDSGDFVIRRKDGLFAYQLAVVVDDAASGVTDIVRGADLLDSTARQIYLYRLLQQNVPRYAHTTLILDSEGNKLSKSSPGDNILKAEVATLTQAWNLLQPVTIAAADFTGTDSFWDWAIANWQYNSTRQDQTL